MRDREIERDREAQRETVNATVKIFLYAESFSTKLIVGVTNYDIFHSEIPRTRQHALSSTFGVARCAFSTLNAPSASKFKLGTIAFCLKAFLLRHHVIPWTIPRCLAKEP